MRLNFIKILILIFLSSSCNHADGIKKFKGQKISINESLDPKSEINDFIKPYKKNLKNSMNEFLCYSTETHEKSDGELNTAIGNMMADAVFEFVSPIIKQQYNLNLDIVLLNHGGIRAPLPKGPILKETAFNIMPFENKVIIAQMRGSVILDMINYLSSSKIAHPISGIKIQISRKGVLKKLSIQGQTIERNKIYNVATNDYLFNGGDRMDFFKRSDTFYKLNYKIRSILIDYFTSKDTLKLKRDSRFEYIK